MDSLRQIASLPLKPLSIRIIKNLQTKFKPFNSKNVFTRRPLARGGYHIFRSVFEKDIYKTNAPMSVIFDTLKGWKFTCDKI